MQRGQSVLEYAVLIGVVIAALLGMQVYAKRGIQAGVKMAADQIGTQGDGIRYESGERRNRAIASAGTVQDRQSRVISDVQKTADISETDGGGRTISSTETTTTSGALGSGAASESTVVVETH